MRKRKPFFDLGQEEVTQGELGILLGNVREKTNTFNEWYAVSDTMSNPQEFPRFEVEPPKDIIDYYNEVGVFDHVIMTRAT